MKNSKAALALLLACLMVWAPASVAWADAPTIQTITGGSAQVIAPVVTAGDFGNHVAITPVAVAAMTSVSSGITTTIRRPDLSEFVQANNVTEVEFITGLGATGSVGAKAAPQLVIIDDDKTVAAVYAAGGQLRMDKKMTGGTLNGRYIVTKNTAIDFVDLRLQYKFTLPQGVSANEATWSWNLRYGSVQKVIHGVNYLPVKGEANTYTSNVVITNIPISSCQDMSFSTAITLRYAQDGVTYTFTQPTAWSLGRTIKALTNQYRNTTGLDAATTSYVNAVYNQMEVGSYTPVL